MTSATGLCSSSSMMSFDPSQAASRMLSRGDKNGDNALSFSEFAGLDDTSSSGSTTSSTTSSISSDRMTALFEAIDSDSDGSVSESELTEFGQKLSDAMSTFMLQMQEQGQFGGQGGADAGAGTGGSSESSESSSYDPLDTNKDGVVSFMERVAGSQSTEQMPPERRRPPSGSEGGMDMLKSMLAASSYQLTGTSELSSSLSSATLALA